MKILQYLSETIGSRVAGTASEHTASQFIAKEFEALGLETNRSEFSILELVFSNTA